MCENSEYSVLQGVVFEVQYPKWSDRKYTKRNLLLF